MSMTPAERRTCVVILEVMDVSGYTQSLSNGVQCTGQQVRTGQVAVELGHVLVPTGATDTVLRRPDFSSCDAVDLTAYSKQRKIMTYVEVVSDINPSFYHNTDNNKMGSVTGRLLSDAKSRDNVQAYSGSCNSLIGERTDNSVGLSPDVVTSNRVKSPTTSTRSVIPGGFWAGTPWMGFSAFRGDLFGKCAQFFHTYIWRRSKTSIDSQSLAKSKTQKGGTSSSLSSSMKQQQQQPDVVTNAITRSNVTKEITRLGALCEARTKELNRIKIDLRRQNTGFEAVAIVVKYFTEELAEAKEQLKKAVLQLEELTRQRDALIDEIQSIKQQHVEETESLMSKHQESLSALSKKLTTEKEEEVKQVIEKHSHEVTTLKSFHERNIKELEEKHDKLMAEKNKQYEEELTRRRLDHEKQINDLHLEHESKLNEITMRFETIKLNLLKSGNEEKVEFLRMEGEELRRREAAMTEKCQRESDYKIQHALAQYKQDVDSLTAVLDLRNGEIHELQRQNLELQKELEKLPVAQDKIKSLEQQIENLQAIIDIRANNERSLSEKHHVLLRKYDKETKVMKRLSMDNEELMYRLQMEAGYQDVMRRSISHSPTSSETSTPEPTRRHKSPLPQSPRSPCEPKRSPVQKTAPRGSMKRTGTYEVLPQEYDDMNNIKQSDI